MRHSRNANLFIYSYTYIVTILHLFIYIVTILHIHVNILENKRRFCIVLNMKIN